MIMKKKVILVDKSDHQLSNRKRNIYIVFYFFQCAYIKFQIFFLSNNTAFIIKADIALPFFCIYP